jgi:signal transduction histidine kinase
VRNSEAQVRQREHLASLGSLSANLAHELNNPAAATVRATSQLRSAVAGCGTSSGLLASGSIPQESLQGPGRAAGARRRAGRQGGPLDQAGRARRPEDAVADRLESSGRRGYELAPVFAASGLDADWVSTAASCVDDEAVPGLREGALRWIAYTLETEALMDEIEDASTRISTLVAAVKDYSHMDAATSRT